MAAPIPAFPNCHADNVVWLSAVLEDLDQTYGVEVFLHATLQQTKELVLAYLAKLDVSIPLSGDAMFHMGEVMTGLESVTASAEEALDS